MNLSCSGLISRVGTRENIKSGAVKINGGTSELYFIGIKNPDGFHGIQVAIEVVAVVLEKEWATREIQQPLIISKKQVPYLKSKSSS